jgi:hypothetical protein
MTASLLSVGGNPASMTVSLLSVGGNSGSSRAASMAADSAARMPGVTVSRVTAAPMPAVTARRGTAARMPGVTVRRGAPAHARVAGRPWLVPTVLQVFCRAGRRRDQRRVKLKEAPPCMLLPAHRRCQTLWQGRNEMVS